jgi:hypothetical protein
MTLAALAVCFLFVLDILAGDSGRGFLGICVTVAVYVLSVLIFCLTLMTKWLEWNAAAGKGRADEYADAGTRLNCYLPVLPELMRYVEQIKEGKITNSLKMRNMEKVVLISEREFFAGGYMLAAVREDLEIRAGAAGRKSKVFDTQTNLLHQRKMVYDKGLTVWSDILDFVIDELKATFPLGHVLIEKGWDCVGQIASIRALVENYEA